MGSGQSTQMGAFVDQQQGAGKRPHAAAHKLAGKQEAPSNGREAGKFGAREAGPIKAIAAAVTGGKMVLKPSKFAHSAEPAAEPGAGGREGRQHRVKFKVSHEQQVLGDHHQNNFAQVGLTGQQKSKGFSLVERESAMKITDPLERRRKSIQNGDVFIYPSLYKDLDQCHLCSRDNRVCNCNNRDEDDDDQEDGGREAKQEDERAQEPSADSSTNDKVLSDSANFVAQRDQDERFAKRAGLAFAQDEEAKTRRQVAVIEDGSAAEKLAGENEEEFKTVYRISIATASIDQKSNQLRISAPKIIVPANKTTGRNRLPHQADERSANRAAGSSYLARSASSSFGGGSARSTSEQSGGSTRDMAASYAAVSCEPIAGDEGSLAEPTSPARLECRKDPAEREEAFLNGRSGRQVGDGGSLLLLTPRQTTDTEGLSEPIVDVETKVTAISIGSPANSPKSLDLRELLPLQSLAGEESSVVGLATNQGEMISCDRAGLQSPSAGGKQRAEVETRIEEEEEQLTCNLYLGDSIKITSTSIRIESNQLRALPCAGQTNQAEQHMSIVPIQSLSSRRRNMASKLSRQAIDEDDYEYRFDQQEAGEQSGTRQAGRLAGLSPRGSDETGATALVTGGIKSALVDEGTGSSCEESNCADVLEYSPILTSVRDYINNVNSEVQVNASSVPASLAGSGSSGSGQVVAASTSTDMDSTSSPNGLVLSGLQQAPCTKNQSASGDKTVVIVNGDDTGQQVDSSTSMITNFAVKTTNELLAVESPKKSIFDGASRDEILEYLEDARERVPEILMAADDVMVIGDNELIVVNQLEPNSPATPISIVDTIEMIGKTGAGASSFDQSVSSPECAPGSPGLKACGSSISSSSPEQLVLEPASTGLSHHHPNQLRQHLQQMYESSKMASSSLDTNNNEPLEGSADQGKPSSPFSDCGEIQFCTTTTSNCLTATSLDHTSATSELDQSEFGVVARGLKSSFSCVTGATLDGSLEDQAASPEPDESSAQSNAATRPVATVVCPPSHTLAGEANRLSSLVARRNSTSEGGSRQLQHNQQLIMARSRALELMAFQQRPAKRNSLSSSSSSPPSSASPCSASSSSSQQTSGNCSVASTFYASSSLSCSSPLLALNNPVHPTSGPSLPQASKRSSAGAAAPESIIGQSIVQPYPMVSFDYQTMLQLMPQQQVERDDSGLGSDMVEKTAATGSGKTLTTIEEPAPASIEAAVDQKSDEAAQSAELANPSLASNLVKESTRSSLPPVAPTFSSSANLMSRTVVGHYATMNRLNNYFINRHPLELNLSTGNSDSTVEFQCLDCDQFIDVDQTTIMQKTNAFRLLKESDRSSRQKAISADQTIGDNKLTSGGKPMISDANEQPQQLSNDQLDRAYIAAMNGLPLCKLCEKKRIERKEIISEFVETELKYGRDLKIIHDEFYRPMQIAGLLSKDQINGVFLNLEELIMAHCRFADRLEIALREAHSMGDTDYNTVNMGRLFVSSAEMLHTFESYCIRQGPAACLLARLAKEKELLRIFLRVSQMENTLLRRMNLAAFLMVPVQRVTKYPLLLNRLYKVTAYHHKDREALRDAQLKVELHLEHINQQTKGFGATNKIWRRISNLSAPISNRRGLINAEDIGYIKLRKTAMDMLKWDRDETQFIHSGKLNFAPLSEFLIKQKMKPIRYMGAHALLVVLGKPNWKYRPDLVKSNLDSKLITPTPGGNGIKETALLLFREKNGRFVPCREPLFLSNCVLSNDCSQFNSECPLNQTSHQLSVSVGSAGSNQSKNEPAISNKSGSRGKPSSSNEGGRESTVQFPVFDAPLDAPASLATKRVTLADLKVNSMNGGDAVSMSSLKSLPEDPAGSLSCSPPTQTSARSYSLASALPRNTFLPSGSASSQSKPTGTANSTILNTLITKVNSYHHHAKQSSASSAKPAVAGDHAKLTQSATNSSASSSPAASMQPIEPSCNGADTTTFTINAATSSNNKTRAHSASAGAASNETLVHYNHHFFHHHQPYGDYEESFEIHERISKESMLVRADTPLKTRYWLQMLRYHAKDLGQWRTRRNGLANIMMMRHE